MKIPEILFAVFFVLIGCFIFFGVSKDKLRRRRIAKFLRQRPQHTDEQFARAFYEHDMERGIVAARVRRVLANNLRLDLNGLNPTDRLNEDLNCELAANPHLFWELESDFRLPSEENELEVLAALIPKLHTFSDLVDHVAGKVKQRAQQPSPVISDPADNKGSRAYNSAIRIIPALFIIGILTVVLAMLFKHDLWVKLGTAIFLSAIVVWGLANGGGFLWTLIQSIRNEGMKTVRANPITTLVLGLLAAFFLWVGGYLLLGIFKLMLRTE